jgi:glycosyltransferase involved in cell wall biosynthesis
MRRPRAVWLVDSADPTGATVMALRRITLLRSRLAITPLALAGRSQPVPAGAPRPGVLRATSLAGEVRIARAELVITSTERTLISAAPRLRPGARLIHFLHTDPLVALRSERFLRSVPLVSALVVPAQVEPGEFARLVGLRADQVVAMDDFTLAEESWLSTATSRVVLAVGQLLPTSGSLELAEGFVRALPELPEWQLRFAGWGEHRRVLEDYVAARGLAARIQLLGARPDVALDYLDAGVVARLDAHDAGGLPVLEALSAGVPVLGAARVPAVRHYVRDGVNGVVLHHLDPPAIADALHALADPHRRSELARGARENRSGLLDDAGRRALLRLVDTVVDSEPTTAIRRAS